MIGGVLQEKRRMDLVEVVQSYILKILEDAGPGTQNFLEYSLYVFCTRVTLHSLLLTWILFI
jgi:hypothetical protein